VNIRSVDCVARAGDLRIRVLTWQDDAHWRIVDLCFAVLYGQIQAKITDRPSMGTTSDTLGMVRPPGRCAKRCRRSRKARGLRRRTITGPCGTSCTQSAFWSARGAMASLACAEPRASARARSYHASPGACHANVLCISLWMFSVNMLVTRRAAVDVRGCGKVDNRRDNALPGRGLSAVHRSASYSWAS
jgi:hypothetical protein